MEHVTIDKGELGMPTKDAVKGQVQKEPKDAPPGPPPPPPATVQQGAYPTVPPGYEFKPAIPKIPVYMDEDEVFVDYRKPGFWSYTPAVGMFFFGLILFVLFLAGGGIVGAIIGGAIFGLMMYIARRKLWARTGYWFTNHKIVYHDGSKIRLIPYDEIALSTLSFEGENCMFSTIYHNEVILKGIIDMEQVVAYISKRVKEERKKGNGASK